nr:NAD-dependent malic enzyme [Pseudomonadota bacterium]
GALDCQASTNNEEMKQATAQAIASRVLESQLNANYNIPSVFDTTVAPKIAKAVEKAAIKTGVARRTRN